VSTPTFPKRDPATAEFWDLRYAARFVPWDAGRVPADFQAFVAAQPVPLRVLVPGCGSGWEVRFLAERGWPVVGLDFSAGALAAARPVLGPFADRVREGDVFQPIAEEPFQLVYERAFLCALPRAMRAQVALRWSQLLVPGGLLAGFFYFDDAPKGPPFGISADELDLLLTPYFERIDDQPVTDSIPIFAGKERWQAWRRLG
jgi:SAM-dependent methyltransferase